MLSQRSPFVLAAHQKYTRETRLGGQISALQRIETTSCAIRAEGHLNATVRGSERSSPLSGSLKLSQPIWSSPLLAIATVEVDMFARNVSFRLKSNMLSDYTRTFENEILPLLRKQRGFQEEITLSNPGNQDATAISLWDSKASAEAYNTNHYPEVLRTLARIIDGTPKVQTFESVTSTFHNAPVAV